MSKVTMPKILTMLLTIALMFSLAACNESGKLKSGGSEVLTLSDTDYANMNNWLSFGGDNNKDVDVFMIYPTVTMSMEDADRPYVRIDSELMRMSAAGWMMKAEDIIDGAANIYAPFYRQLNAAELGSLNSDTFVYGEEHQGLGGIPARRKQEYAND